VHRLLAAGAIIGALTGSALAPAGAQPSTPPSPQNWPSKPMRMLDAPDVRRKLEQEAIVTEKMSPAQFTRFVENEIGKWGPLAKAAIGAQGSGN
jgi:tripartite-type tricarboxylate transporter receptor subunit TctC